MAKLLQSSNIITYNSAGDNEDGFGGAILCNYDCNALISCNTISNNTARIGGGINCANGSNATIPNNIINSNSAYWNGGGIHFERANPTVNNNTLTENSAVNNGGGIFCNINSIRGTGHTVIYRFNPCFLRLLCNCIHGRSSQPGILCFNPCFPGPFCNSVYGKMFRLLSLSCFNPCFLRLLCNLLLVTTKHMGSIISILVFVDLFATNLFFKRKALPKELYFCFAKSISVFISGDNIGTRFLDQTFF